jgi:hypothetical protein
MADKYFTWEEAQTLLPVLESLLRTCMDGKKLMQEVEAELQQVRNRIFVNGGMLVDLGRLALRRGERDKAVLRVKDAMAEIDSIGVQVKDLDIGLLDFPSIYEDQVILLCWKMGEKSISHWHDTQEGFAGRKPLTAEMKKATRKKTN